MIEAAMTQSNSASIINNIYSYDISADYDKRSILNIITRYEPTTDRFLFPLALFPSKGTNTEAIRPVICYVFMRGPPIRY